jgi:eukaryotic-like serine/threonine-protein kinase
MIPDQWKKAKELFDAAMKRPSDERLPFIEENCNGDEEVRREVESLLANSEDAADFLEKPAVGELVKAIVGDEEKLRVDQILSHYKIIKLLGAGGMGEVYLAEDTRLHREVALKVLPENIAADQERLHRFEQEAAAASALNHPNILTVHEFGFETDIHFLATEFVDGETLREKINEGKLSLTDSLNISEQTAFAILTAHASGIIHRDIKPENIMIRRDGIVKVLDFGLAKLIEKKLVISNAEAETRALVKTKPGVIMGTASYMSPEQARGKETDARTDIFSLGIVLYEMLTGHLPFTGETMNDTISAILTKDPPPLARYVSNVSTELERIVRKALTKEPDDRHQTARDLMIDIKTLRRDLDLHGELDRPVALNKSHEQVAGKDSDRHLHIAEDKLTDSAIAVPTKDRAASDLHSTSSAEYLIGEIKHHKRGFTGVLSILLLAAIGFGYWYYTNRSASIDAEQINSVAVLPFENGIGDTNLDYLSDGLSESLIDYLSQLPQLKVIARSSSFKYRGQNPDLKEIADALGVKAIVTGRVTQRGDNLIVRVEMVDAGENRQLWSGQFTRKATDAFAVQQEVAQTVSEQLHFKLSGAQQQKLAKREMVNGEAYELVLKGRFLNIKGGTENSKKAVEYYRQAIAIDPNYALAHAFLSHGYLSLVGPGILDPKAITPKAYEAARKALELDPNLADAHHAMANLYQDDWKWTAAETEYKRTIELNPNLVTARNNYSAYLSIIGRHDEALAEARRAKELDPLTISNLLTFAYTLAQARRYDEAIAEFKKILEVDANNIAAYNWLGFAYSGKGMYREAVDCHQELIRRGDNNSSRQIYLGAAFAKAGEREKAQAILQQLETSREYVSPGELPVLYVALGEREKAFASFEKAYAAHDLQLQFLKVEAFFDPLRDDPRFQDLQRRVGLPQ